MKTSRIVSLLACLAACLAPPLTTAQAADFYRGKQVTIIVGFSAGGGYDLTARLIARHYGRHLAGYPNVIVQNLAGGGSLVAASSLYAGSPQDGTRLGMIAGGSVLEPLLGNTQAKFDARRFQWIGGRSTEPSICGIRAAAPAQTMADVTQHETIVGASGPGSRTLSYPKILNELLGTKFKVVNGYPGSNEISLAMQSGEVDGQCGLSWGTAKTRMSDWLSDGRLRILAQFGLERAHDLADVPMAGELAKSDRDRQAIEFLESDAVLAWPLLAPPKVPPERVAELRAGFAATLADPEFLADAAQQQMEVDLVTGAKLQDLVAHLYDTPAETIALVKRAVAGD